MKFTPLDSQKKGQAPKFPPRAATTLTTIIGEKRKANFGAFCKRHNTTQTKMICQMIDHCMDNS